MAGGPVGADDGRMACHLDDRESAAPATMPSTHAACDARQRLEALARVPFFAGLDADRLREVHALASARELEGGQVAVAAGGRADELLVVASGALRWSRPTAEGKEVVLDVLGPGDPCGSLPLLGDTHHVDDVVALTPSCVLAFDAATFGVLLERYPGVTRRVLELVAERLRHAHETIRQLSVGSVEQRIAAVLTRLDLHLSGGAGGARLPLTQQDLADMVGSAPETVNRVLARLRRRRAVETGRGWIRVADPAGLVADGPPA